MHEKKKEIGGVEVRQEKEESKGKWSKMGRGRKWGGRKRR